MQEIKIYSWRKPFLFNMYSRNEEVILIATIARKSAKENFGWSYGCKKGLNFESIILYCRKWSLQVWKVMKILYLSDKMSQTLSSGISKFTTPAPLCLHTFLHRMNTSGVKIRPILKKTNDIYWTWKANIAKIIIICENNYSRGLFLQNVPL